MPGNNYKVLRKNEIRKVNAAGEAEIWYRITAESAEGTVFSVEISEKNLDNAPSLISEKARKLDALT